MAVLIAAALAVKLQTPPNPRLTPPEWLIQEAFFIDDGTDGWVYERNVERGIPTYQSCGGAGNGGPSSEHPLISKLLREKFDQRFARHRLDSEPLHLHVAFPDNIWRESRNQVIEELAQLTQLERAQITLSFPPASNVDSKTNR